MDSPLNSDDILGPLLVPSARGRAKAPLSISYIRNLGPGDVEALMAPEPLGSQPTLISKLRSPHHQIARLLAEGRKAVEVSYITGYSQSRISILQNDPMFRELLSYYATQTEALYLDVHARLAALGIATMEELQERLEAEPDKFTKKELMELMQLCFDRSITPGARPQSGGAEVTVNVKLVTPEARPTGPIIDLESEII